MNPAIIEKDDGCLLKCRIQPRSSHNAVVGIYGETLKIALTAPPVDGKANRCLLGFLGMLLDLPPGKLRLTTGKTSRNKTVFIPAVKAAVMKKLS